jgi:hypothetical protein
VPLGLQDRARCGNGSLCPALSLAFAPLGVSRGNPGTRSKSQVTPAISFGLLQEKPYRDLVLLPGQHGHNDLNGRCCGGGSCFFNFGLGREKKASELEAPGEQREYLVKDVPQGGTCPCQRTR